MQRWSMAVRLSGCNLGANEPVLGCDKLVLGCDLGGAISTALGCNEADASGAMGSLLFLSLFYFPGMEIL